MWNLLQAIKRSWLKHFITQTTAVFILTITYTASFFIVLSVLNIKNVFFIWGKVNQVTVYLDQTPKETEVKKLMGAISSKDFVESVRFVSPQQSASQFEKRFSKHTPQQIKASQIKDFFPSSLHIELQEPISSQADILNLKSFSNLLKRQYAFVDEVIYGQSWMTKFVRLLQGFETMSWLLVGVIFLSSLFVSMNVFKTIIHAQKEEIDILQFIGATDSWIYGPPVINCCILSTISFAAAILCNYGVYNLLNQSFSQMFSSYVLDQAEFFSPVFLTGFYVFLLGAVLLTSIAGTTRVRSARGEI